MGRSRHAIFPDHLLPGVKTKVGHGEILGAEGLALAAEGAAVDEAIGLMDALDDRRIIVDPPGIGFRISAVFRQIDTVADTFQALAVDAAAGLGDRFLPADSRPGSAGTIRSGRQYPWFA